MDKILTSVKIDREKWGRCKLIATMDRNLTLEKIVDEALDMYLEAHEKEAKG